jgi:hypothetical protein
MTTRTTSRTATFEHPFFLRGMSAMQPAGSYTVDTDEERLDTASGSAYRRVGSWIWLPAGAANPGMAQMLSIDPVELAAALVVDGRQAQAGEP